MSIPEFQISLVCHLPTYQQTFKNVNYPFKLYVKNKVMALSLTNH